jgi:transcriptional regulator with XRE-family HTH domain
VDANALGQAVRAQRLTAGLRIDDAAALCGVSVTVLSRLENAASGISTQNLFKVLDGLGLTLFAFSKAHIPQTLANLSRPAGQ